MTACVLSLAGPPERLEYDVSRYMEPDLGPTWPQEAHQVFLNDLKPELQNPEKAEPLMKQLESRGFAVLKKKSKSLGSLESQAEWNSAYLEVKSSTSSYTKLVLTYCTYRKQLSKRTPPPNTTHTSYHIICCPRLTS